MSDDSVNIWARLEDTIPELTTFSICTWVKFTFEVHKYYKIVKILLQFFFNTTEDLQPNLVLLR